MYVKKIRSCGFVVIVWPDHYDSHDLRYFELYLYVYSVRVFMRCISSRSESGYTITFKNQCDIIRTMQMIRKNETEIRASDRYRGLYRIWQPINFTTVFLKITQLYFIGLTRTGLCMHTVGRQNVRQSNRTAATKKAYYACTYYNIRVYYIDALKRLKREEEKVTHYILY